MTLSFGESSFLEFCESDEVNDSKERLPSLSLSSVSFELSSLGLSALSNLMKFDLSSSGFLKDWFSDCQH